jgi:hypothetical protein
MQKASPKRPAAKQIGADEILPEYDFSNGKRNKYASRYVQGNVVVRLDKKRRPYRPSSK